MMPTGPGQTLLMGQPPPSVRAPWGPMRRRHTVPAAALLVLVVLVAACGASPRAARPSSSSTATTATSTTASPSTTVPTAPSWTTYGGSVARTSLAASFPAVTTAPRAAWTSAALDGGVYGEPLIDDGQVLVATENDTVYDLSASNGTVAWSDHLASAVPAGDLPCGDILPTVGVTSTMVIDPASGTLYASAETDSNGVIGHQLFAISLASHRTLWSRDLDQPGWTAAAQLQRIALALDDGHVLVGFGGNAGDCAQYHGWVVGVPEAGTGSLLVYQVPTAREGAIWAPAGVTVDGGGDVYVATGNGSASAGQPFDHGDAVIKLSPSLAELSYFAPSNWAQDNADDGDLGSTAPVLLDGGQAFEVGKETTAYLLNTAALGGIGGQVASLDVCPSLGGNAYQPPDVYVVCTDAGEIAQVVVGPGNTMHRGWTWTSPTGGASSPTIAGGVVWSIDLKASVLYGIDEGSGTTRYSLPLDVGQAEHFATPSAAGGMIVVAGSRSVEAFR
jgi:outer membrane protein assembly factor BamB